MKIGILTQPLEFNYGGLIQAWALQHVLTGMGHEVTIINRVMTPRNKKLPLWYRILSKLKNEFLIKIGRRKKIITLSPQLKSYVDKHLYLFKETRYANVSFTIDNKADFIEYIKNNPFEAYIVGSDQVWRPKYSPDLMTYFLDFLKDDKNVKKIAYAASFGVNTWELTKAQTKTAAKLASLFDVLTVREASGVNLVAEHFHCEAHHVLDPTMLLQKEDYLALINKPTQPLRESDGKLFCYTLDKSTEKNEIIKKCAKSTGLRPFYCMPKLTIERIETEDHLEDSIVPPIEQWLKSFSDAEMVVTDSYHGVAFSIIFNKRFWVIINPWRGAARFSSILELFNLEERIIDFSNEPQWSKPIDWNYVNARRYSLILDSMKYLDLSSQNKEYCNM